MRVKTTKQWNCKAGMTKRQIVMFSLKLRLYYAQYGEALNTAITHVQCWMSLSDTSTFSTVSQYTDLVEWLQCEVHGWACGWEGQVLLGDSLHFSHHNISLLHLLLDISRLTLQTLQLTYDTAARAQCSAYKFSLVHVCAYVYTCYLIPTSTASVKMKYIWIQQSMWKLYILTGGGWLPNYHLAILQCTFIFYHQLQEGRMQQGSKHNPKTMYVKWPSEVLSSLTLQQITKALDIHLHCYLQ